MNSDLLAKRRRPARPIRPSDDAERNYRRNLIALVQVMARAVAAEVMPILREEKAQFTGDAVVMDRWTDRLIAALQRAADRFTGEWFEQSSTRLAKSTVSMAEAESTAAFLKSVNEAVGVDLSPVLGSAGMVDYLDMAVADNVSLIKSIATQYHDRVQNIVMNGVRNGDAPSTIAKALQAQTGVTRRRARFIARDQVAKMNGDIVERRQTQAGITHYRAIDSGDERVTGRPGGKYQNAKIKCWEIARKDVGFGPGVYSWKKGATAGGKSGLHPGKHHPGCRCTASPVMPWELPER